MAGLCNILPPDAGVFPTMTRKQILDSARISEIVEMALSDKASFDDIRNLYGFGPDEVKTIMQRNLKPGSYRAWRKRVRQFSDRRERYK